MVVGSPWSPVRVVAQVDDGRQLARVNEVG
jgi:hypothetical protein